MCDVHVTLDSGEGNSRKFQRVVINGWPLSYTRDETPILTSFCREKEGEKKHALFLKKAQYFAKWENFEN